MIQKTPSRKKSVLTASIGLALGATLLLSGCTTAPSSEAGLSNESLSSIGDKTSDELGSYTNIRVKNNVEYEKLSAEQLGMAYTWKDQGLSNEDALAAKQFALEWASTQLLDSLVLDNPKAEQSFREQTSSYFSEISSIENYRDLKTEVYRLPAGLATVRDGQTRMSNITNFLGGKVYVSGGSYLLGDTVTPLISVEGGETVTYRLSPESVLSWYEGLHPELTIEEVKSKLNLGKEKAVPFIVDISWSYTLAKSAAGNWQIVVDANSFTPVSLNGKTNLASELSSPK